MYFVDGTIAERLNDYAAFEPDRVAFRFLDAQGGLGTTFTYAGLATRVAEIAGGLRERGLTAGARVVVSSGDPQQFLLSFLAVVHAGGIPVPAPVRDRRRRRLQEIVADCAPFALLADDPSGTGTMVGLHGADGPAVFRPTELRGPVFAPVRAGTDEPLVLQYTSGSTGAPKGVVVTHGALAANSAMIAAAFGHDRETRFASWLPLFHDMGLVGAALHPLLIGADATLMPPEGFFQQPHRWLRMIFDFGATTSGAPDFAYSTCAATADAATLEGIDLSRWKVAYSGAEPVRVDTLRRFEAAMAPFGFSPTAWLPCYGMAETTLLSAGRSSASAPRTLEVGLDALAGAGKRSDAAPQGPVREFVGIAAAVPGVLLRIVDPASGCALQDGEIGEIWVAGDHVACRYWGDDRDIRTGRLAEHGDIPFLRTGDLGFLLAGHLHVAGRLKDLIVIAGRNVHPYDIEKAAGEHPALAGARAVAFGLPAQAFASYFGVAVQPLLGDELPVLLIESGRTLAAANGRQIASVLFEHIAEQCELDLCAVVFVGRGEIELTTSGKLRRPRAAEKLLQNGYRLAAAHLSPLLDNAFEAAVGGMAEALRQNASPAVLAMALSRACVAIAKAPKAGGADLSLAACGLSSIGALALSRAVAAGTGVSLPLEMLYNGTSLLDIARFMQASARQDGARHAVEPLPLRAGISEMILQRRAASGDGAYGLAFSISGPAAVMNPAVEEATLLRRSMPSFRLRFGWSGVALPAAAENLAITPTDLGSFENRAAVDRAFRLAAQEAFDLAESPVRLFLANDPRDRSLLVMIHHGVADVWTVLAVALRLLGAVGVLRSRPSSDAHAVPHRLVAADRRADRRIGGEGASQPLPRDRAGVAGGRPLSAPFAMAADVMEALAHSTGQTVFCVLLTCLGTAIGRWSGDWVRIVAVPVADGSDGIGGYGVRMVPVRIDISPTQRFVDAVQSVAAALANAVRLADTAVQSKPSTSPEIAAVHLTSPPGVPAGLMRLALRRDDDPFEIGGLRLLAGGFGPHAIEQPIEVVTFEERNAVDGMLRLDSALFHPSTATHLAGALSGLAEAAATKPDALLAELADTGLQASGSRDVADVAAQDVLHQMLERVAEHDPSAIAMESHGRQVDYRTLVADVERLAARLLALGRVFRRIAVHSSDPVRSAVAAFAAMKAGAAFVPIDPALPLARQAATVRQSQADLLLYAGERPAVLSLSGTSLAALAVEEGHTAPMPATWPVVAPGDAAYLVFTSGSTGTPKGIVQTHDTFSRFLAWQAEALDIRPGARVAQIASPGFDVSLCEIFGALCFGATLLAPNRSADLAPDRLLPWLAEAGATTVQITPNLLSAGLRAGDGWPSGLRIVANVGEPLPVAMAAELLRRGGEGVRLINIYGPSETIAATWHLVTPADLTGLRIPVGTPIPGRTIEIRDEAGRPVPVGVRGDVHIRTAFMSDGYVEAGPRGGFVLTPRAADDGVGLYGTGDIGRWRSDGSLELFGRADNQIKVNGVRIELEEVELALMRHPAVTAALAFASRTQEGGSRLMAAVEAAPDTDGEAVRRMALQALPPAMAPAFVAVLPRLPRTQNGKVDRRRLSVDALERAWKTRFQSVPVQPMDEMQRQVATLWADILPDAPPLGPDSNFFASGGHSINAMQLLNALRLETGAEVGLADFLAEPTLAALAERAVTALVPAPRRDEVEA